MSNDNIDRDKILFNVFGERSKVVRVSLGKCLPRKS